MLLESFKAGSDSGYLIVPKIVEHTGYISYSFSGMSSAEVAAWQKAVTIPEVRRLKPLTAEDYLKALQTLGIRCALSGTEACRILRAEYHSQPLSRRTK